MSLRHDRTGAMPGSVEQSRPPASQSTARIVVRSGAAMLFAASMLCTASAYAAGPALVDLGIAKFFVILTEAGITDVFPSAVFGSVGTSPITGAADLLSCSGVNGRILSVDAAGPAPCSTMHPASLTRSILAMETAYTDAAGRTPDVTDLAGGAIGGLTITPGTYKWTGSVMIGSNVTFAGGHNDVWILQVAQDVDLANATAILLSGGALARNIFWQVAGQVTMGTTSQFEGIVLAKTSISMKTGASITGRLYSQTAVSLEMNAVNKPGGHS
jgi:hypothetical protein